MDLPINANEVLGQFERIQQAAQRTSEVITAANKLSGNSFNVLSGVMDNVSVYTYNLSNTTRTLSGVLNGCRESLGLTINTLQNHAQHLGFSALESIGLTGVTEKFSEVDLFSREGLAESIDILKGYGQEMFLSGLESIGLGGLTEKLTDIDLLSRDGFRESIGVLGDYARGMVNNARETLRLFDVRNSMTDAEGNFCLQAAKATALTIFNTAMLVKNKLASIFNAAQKKREAVATKAGAKVDAVGAKAKMALTAAKPFIGPIMVAAAGVALGVGIGLLVRKLRTPVPLATGGVATNTTFAMIGEGKYDEAVVPLGNSPQFRSMKEDIANAVLQGMGVAMSKRGSTSSRPGEIVLNIDGTRLARVMLPNLVDEQSRVEYGIIAREAF